MFIWKSGEYDKAKNSFDKAIALDPNRSKYYVGQGNANVRLDKIDDAIASFEKALKVNPNDAEALERLGDIYAKLGDWAKAADYYKKALDYNSKDKNLQDKYALALRMLKGSNKIAIADNNSNNKNGLMDGKQAVIVVDKQLPKKDDLTEDTGQKNPET